MIENSALYNFTKEHTPQSFRNYIRFTVRSLADVYAGLRGLNPNCALPDFLIVGAQKAGTTSLFNWLLEADVTQAPLYKEVGYFDARWNWPINYRGYFGTRKPASLVGEATPSYFAFPEVPERVSSVLGPTCKIIIILRDPVDRSVSHYFHERRLGFENRDMYTAMIEEENLIKVAFDKSTSASRRRHILTHYSYAYRSEYSKRLTPWFEHFDRENILIIKSELMFKNPHEIVNSVADFLRVDINIPTQLNARNTNPYVFEDSRVASFLKDRLSTESSNFENWTY